MKKYEQLEKKSKAIINFMKRVREKTICDGALSYRYLDSHYDEEHGVLLIEVLLSEKESSQLLEFSVEDYLEEYKLHIDRSHKLVEIIRKPTWMSVEEFQAK